MTDGAFEPTRGATFPRTHADGIYFPLVEVVFPERGPKVIDIGEYHGRFTYKPSMALEIAGVILDRAERNGRLASAARAGWERWVGEVVDLIAGFNGRPEQVREFETGLAKLLGKPRPETGIR